MSGTALAALLLDTHIALWLDSGDKKLLPATAKLIDACWQASGTIYVSAITAWEIALLVDTGRIELDVAADEWVSRFLNRPGIAPAALSPAVAARAYDLQDFEHRDPADRLLVASAIALGCPLVSYDARIARFGKKRGKRYGFAVVG